MTDAVNEKELQEERKKIISRILEIQKKFMELERKKGLQRRTFTIILKAL